MLRGCAGLTVMAGSISAPGMRVSSNIAPGQPPGNGLGPEIACRCFTLYWPATVAAGEIAVRRAIARIKRERVRIAGSFLGAGPTDGGGAYGRGAP